MTTKEMEQKTKTLDSIEELRQKRQALSEDMYGSIEQAQKSYQRGAFADPRQATRSKLDTGIQKFHAYKGEIADLAAGLTENLQDYVDFVAKGSTFKGIEHLVKIFAPKKALHMRKDRLMQQNPRENLKLVLDYAEKLVGEILVAQDIAGKTYERLTVNTDIIVAKIEEYEPQERMVKEKLDAMEAEYKKLEEQTIASQDSQQRAQLEVQKNDLHKELTVVREDYDKILTIYSQAEKALEANKQSRNSFEQMKRDLGIQATMIKEKMDNVTEIYKASPDAIKIMMTTKGMENLDKVMNVATDKSVDMIVQSAEGVTEATTARAKTPIIDPDVMRQYAQRVEEMIANFNAEHEFVRQDTRKNREADYAPKK
jgi:hypothetical protein